MQIHNCTEEPQSDCCYGYIRDETVLVLALLPKLICRYTNTPSKKIASQIQQVKFRRFFFPTIF